MVLTGGPAQTPRSLEGLRSLHIVEARVVRGSSVDGDVEVLSVCQFGDWLGTVAPDRVSPAHLQALCPGVPMTDLVAEARRDGAAYWKTGARHWRSLDEPTAVVVVHEEPADRVAALRTNAVPGGVFAIAADAS